MAAATEQADPRGDFLSAVALLRDLPQHRLVRGQVGAIVEALDETTALVEFSDDEGHAYAIVPCPRDALLVLRTAPLPHDLDGATPKIDIDPETYEVKADGVLLTCEPAETLSMAQRYFLF